MTPLTLEAYCRNQYNATNDSFFGQDEMMDYIYAACLELNRECSLIENAYTTTSVSSQENYALPDRCIKVKKITYDGDELIYITQKEWERLKLADSSTLPAGSPAWFTYWDDEVWLLPEPDTDGLTIQIYSYDEPDAVTTTSSLEIPTQFHPDLSNYVLSRMYAKDKDFNAAGYYKNIWDESVEKIKRWNQKRLKGSAFAHVIDEDIGII